MPKLLDWQQRVEDERFELEGRYHRLAVFIAKGAPGVEGEDLVLLQAQQEAMRAYLAILNARVARFL